MTNELIEKEVMALQSMGNLELSPALFDEETSLVNYTKLSISRIPALGTAFEPIASAVQRVVGSSGATTGLYKVTIPSGTHLAEFKSGVGNLGTSLDANNQIAGQAVLNPLVCNPTMIFMAAALANIDKQIDAIQSAFKEYQLAIYTHSFSSFLDVMLVGNYVSEYLSGIKQKIESYSWQYRELYTKCYDQLEAYFGSSIQSTLLKGLKSVSKATGEAIAKVPVVSKGSIDEALIEAGSKLDRFETQRTVQQLRQLVDCQGSCVRPFVENIEMIERLYNHSLNMVFDKDTVYIGIEEEAS